MILTSAQFEPVDGDVQANLEKHYQLIGMASSCKADLIVFAEMSITSYLHVGASEMAFTPDDPRLEKLKQLSAKHQLSIIAGAPIKENNQLFIGSFVIHPNGATDFYTKHFLHPGEEVYFSPSFEYDPQINVEDELLSLAICADIDHPEHIAKAVENKATIYVPSIFFSANGIGDGYRQLSGYAKKHQIPVLMSNFCGYTWNTEAAGKSAFWDSTGQIVAAMGKNDEGILVVEKKENRWVTHVFKI